MFFCTFKANMINLNLHDETLELNLLNVELEFTRIRALLAIKGLYA